MIIFGWLFFKESFILQKALGAFLILGGNGLLFYEKRKIKIDKNVVFAIISNLSLAIALSIDVNNSSHFNLFFYIGITMIIPAIIIKIFGRIPFSDLKSEFQNLNKRHILALSLVWVGAVYTTFRSLQLGKMTVVVPLQSLSVPFNVFIAYIFLKEKKDLFKKIIVALIVFLGIYFTI